MSRLRAVKPELIQKRFKALFYGKAGAGKTTAAIQFPKPYLIDTERGAENKDYVEKLEARGGVVFQTVDFDEIIAEITALLTEKHDYKTLIIDSLTPIFEDLCEKWAKKLATTDAKGNMKSDGMEFSRHKDRAGIQIKHLYRLLLRLDMNVIITSHSKSEWQKDGKEMVEVGQTFDCYKKMDFLFDVLFHIKKITPTERIAIITKTRLKDEFPDGTVMPFSYEEIANRYGKELIERDMIPETLATSSQVSELNQLIKLLNVPVDTTEKWLKKANAENFSEMNTQIIQKCIDSLKEKVNASANDHTSHQTQNQ